MKVIMSMTELLGRLKAAKRKMEYVYSTNLDANSMNINKNRKMLVSVKPAHDAERNINGIPIDNVSESIAEEFESLINAIDTYRRLYMVKEIVNNDISIFVPDYKNPDSLVEMKVATALVYTNKQVKNFYTDLLQLMKDDYNAVCNAIESHNKTALSNENIRAYVMAKITSLGQSPDEDRIRYHYREYADEYINASEYMILDPIDISNKIKILERWIDRFYTTIDYKLAEINAITKVWVDLSEDNSWGYAVEDNTNIN